jgi:hypothetical protein
MNRRPTRRVGAESKWSGVGIAIRTSWRKMASPNSLDTLYPAWMRDTAELGSCGWLGSGGNVVGSSLVWPGVGIGVGIAIRTSWRMMASPNSLDTLYPAWMRDTAELDSGGWLGSGGSDASFPNAGPCLRLRGSDRDRIEVG